MRVDFAPLAPKNPLPGVFLPTLLSISFPGPRGVGPISPGKGCFPLPNLPRGASRPSITRGRRGSHPRQHKGHRILGPQAGLSDLMGGVWKELPAVAR